MAYTPEEIEELLKQAGPLKSVRTGNREVVFRPLPEVLQFAGYVNPKNAGAIQFAKTTFDDGLDS